MIEFSAPTRIGLHQTQRQTDANLKGAKTLICLSEARGGLWEHRSLLFSFIYLVFVSLLKLLAGSGRSAQVKDIELIVLCHQLRVLRRQVERPRLRSSGRAFLAATSRLLPPRRRHRLLVTPHRPCSAAPRARAAVVDILPVGRRNSISRVPSDAGRESRGRAERVACSALPHARVA